MNEEQEYIFHKDIDNDESSKVRHHDNDKMWTVESYDKRLTRKMLDLGADCLANASDAQMFRLDAKQLIVFIAESSGLIVEFRNRRRQQLTPEKAEARRLRMAFLNAQQRAKV